MLYFTLLDRIQKNIIYLCEKGNSSACFIKILYNLDSKFRDVTSAAEETVEILERSERRCENKVDFMECAVASIFYTLSGNYEKAEYYLNKIKDYR
ncbi:MAG: hypothetical protein LM575_07550 [Caldimicrobium sp.]|nr:hypothetical protein [Caldimicrobium sp.]